MMELRKRIFDITKEIYQGFVETLKEGEKTGGVDLSEVIAQQSVINQKISNSLDEATIRIGESKGKKGWFK